MGLIQYYRIKRRRCQIKNTVISVKCILSGSGEIYRLRIQKALSIDCMSRSIPRVPVVCIRTFSEAMLAIFSSYRLPVFSLYAEGLFIKGVALSSTVKWPISILNQFTMIFFCNRVNDHLLSRWLGFSAIGRKDKKRTTVLFALNLPPGAKHPVFMARNKTI